MKIGLLTIHDTSNFGSLLQTYALYRIIMENGFDCEVIDYECDAISKREIPQPNFSKNIKNIIRQLFFTPAKIKKYQCLTEWRCSHIKMSSEKYNKSNINKTSTYYDLFIVGSDLVWGADITGYDYTYFLDFLTDNTKKYAFASSMGSGWLDDKIAKLLSQFQFISVREQDAAEKIETLIGKRITTVADPTMLISPQEWVKLKRDVNIKNSYVLIYYKDKRNKIFDDAKKFAKLNNCSIYYINYSKPVIGMHNIKPLYIEEFLGLIYGARAIFSGSYHGLLFSLYFHKEIYAYKQAHSFRMDNIQNVLRIDNHISSSELLYIDNRQAQYDNRIDTFRKYSISILKEKILKNA